MLFRDRKDAGERLAGAVKEKNYERPLILGIPRGGVPVAAEVARAVEGELAVVVARKLGAPGNPELAIGATTAAGATYVNTAVAMAAGADKRYIAAEKERQIREARRREELFDSQGRPPARGRTVVIVDDGIATGATAIAAVRSLKAEGAARVVLAVPVGPPETLELLRREADEVICLHEDPGFWAVGQFYIDFEPVSDEEVVSVLKSWRAKAAVDAETRVDIWRGDVRLAAVFTTPSGAGPFPLVVFVHGLGSGKDSPRNVVIATRLVDAGIATLLFDLSGHGESTTDPRDGLEAYVADVEAAFAWAVRQPEVRPDLIGIAGSSLGATIAAAALAEGRVSPRTLVLRAPPMTADELARVRVPALVVIGSLDPLRGDVEPGAAANPNLTLAVVAGASHLFEEPGALAEALRLTVDWFRSRLLAPVAASG